MNDLCIDPGYAKAAKGCACALGRRGEVVEAWFERPSGGQDLALAHGSRVDRVIVEQPQQDGRSWGVPPEVLIQLSWAGALLGGLYAGRFRCPLLAVTPSEWKGPIAKPVHHKQFWKVATDLERAILGGPETGRMIVKACRAGALDRWGKPGGDYYPKSWLTHNLLDAACMVAAFARRIPRP